MGITYKEFFELMGDNCVTKPNPSLLEENKELIYKDISNLIFEELNCKEVPYSEVEAIKQDISNLRLIGITKDTVTFLYKNSSLLQLGICGTYDGEDLHIGVIRDDDSLMYSSVLSQIFPKEISEEYLRLYTERKNRINENYQREAQEFRRRQYEELKAEFEN